MIVGSLALFAGLIAAVGTFYFAGQWQSGLYGVAGVIVFYGGIRFVAGLTSSVRNEAK